MTHVRALAPGLDLLALQGHARGRYPLLLESVASGTAQGRWDMLLAGDGTRFALGSDGIVRHGDGHVADGAFLDVLDAAWRAACRPAAGSPWPFRGGWALLLGYE